MKLSTFDHLDLARAAGWDELAPPDFHFRSDFLQVMQESGVEHARYRYLLLHERGRPVALAVLSHFTLKLDLLARDRWTALARRLDGDLLDVPIICCGIPASFGQHHLHLLAPCDVEQVAAQVHAAMEAWAAEERCSMLVFKEWQPGHAVHGALRQQGYLALPTLPDHRLDCRHGGASDFLSRLRSGYRRRYREAAALMRGTGSRWESGTYVLERLDFDRARAAAFHHGYSCVVQRASTRLETYPAEFFLRLADSALQPFLLRLSRRGTDDRLDALMIPGGETLTFALIAKERPRYAGALYRTLLQCLALYAIETGCAELRLGQTSDFAKRSIGATPRRLETLVRMRSRWKHRLLACLGSQLFPERPSPDLTVFRRGAAEASERQLAGTAEHPPALVS